MFVGKIEVVSTALMTVYTIQVVTNRCNSYRHQGFIMRETFFKNEISENIYQKFHDQ